MDNKKTTKEVYEEISSLVSLAKYKEASKRLEPYIRAADPMIYRSRYLLSSTKGSPFYKELESKKILDGLCKLSDSWGCAEKGHCLLNGIFYKRDTYLAEDFLINASETEPRAAFLLADIHGNGLHRDDDGLPVYDLSMAIELYLELTKTESVYKLHACENYCRLMMHKGNLNNSQKVDVFAMILSLIENGHPGSETLYTKYLTEEMSLMSGKLFKKRDDMDFEDVNLQAMEKANYKTAVNLIKEIIINKES